MFYTLQAVFDIAVDVYIVKIEPAPCDSVFTASKGRYCRPDLPTASNGEL
ncbi:hypothetical protein S7335_4680 [Synechococcus sp. PCC 7335]|nr:hypothetical protein S7335_4680 [Synechococcus sp. PCC 7335]